MDRENELRIAKEIYGGRFELICTKMQLLNCPTYDVCWLEGTPRPLLSAFADRSVGPKR
jgi:hypothetical protein